MVEEPTPGHDESSSAATPEQPVGGHSGAEPPAGDVTPPEPAVVTAKDRRSNEFWLALASSVVAAVVGVSAIGSSWYTANQQDREEITRNQANFTRSQQKEAFAGFINSAGDLAIALHLQVKAIENRYPYFPNSPIPEGKADVEGKFTDFGHALDLAQLYGSARVRDESNKAFDAAAQSRLIIVGWQISYPADAANEAPCPELLAFENKTEMNRQQLANAIDRFNDAAREDLGIAPLPPTSTPPEPLLPKDACTRAPH